MANKLTHTFDLHHFRDRAAMDQNPTAKGFGQILASPIAKELAPVEKEMNSASEGAIHPQGFTDYEKGVNPFTAQYDNSQKQEENDYLS